MQIMFSVLGINFVHFVTRDPSQTPSQGLISPPQSFKVTQKFSISICFNSFDSYFYIFDIKIKDSGPGTRFRL